MQITFRQIDAFRTVVSTGSVTRAAKVLGVSQPAVSRLLSDLEQATGLNLFNRSGRNLVPTEEALLLAEEVRRTFSGLEHIRNSARSIREFAHARLRIVSTPAMATTIAPDLIEPFANALPDASVSLEIQTVDDAIEWMVSREFDFGIAPPLRRSSALGQLLLSEQNAMCIAPSRHEIASRNEVRAADLGGVSFISYFPDSPFRHEVDRVFDQAGVSRQLQYEARTTDALCRLVAAGLGISIVGAPLKPDFGVPNISVLPFSPAIEFRCALIWSRHRPMSAIAKQFLELAQEAFSLNSEPT